MEALAVEIMRVSETNMPSKLAGAQLSKFPKLFCSNEGDPYIRANKTGVVKFIETRYPGAFLKTNTLKGAPIIIDSLQDILIKPTAKEVTFGNYIELFKSTKVKPYFRFSTKVVLVFDSPKENSPKYMIRKYRDGNIISQHESINFNEETPIPPGLNWQGFLSNRENKQKLVNLIVSNLKESLDMLRDLQELFIASDSCVYKVTNENCHDLSRILSNNHEEADTLMFALFFGLEFKECIIKSTDSDVLCVACINQNKFREDMRVLIQSNTVGSELKYIDLNLLFNFFKDDRDTYLSVLKNRFIPLGVVYGIIHFLSGCDYLPHLRVFTKKACCDAVIKYGNDIFPDEVQEEDLRLWKDEHVKLIAMNFHVSLYYSKYGRCFANKDEEEFCRTEDQLENIVSNVRKKTWHKTLTQCCNIPTAESLHLAGLRFLYVFKILSRATDLQITGLDVYEYGWKKCPVSSQPVPVWDSVENEEKVDLLLKTTLAKCGCKKNMCKTKQCSCVRRGLRCSVLCTCINCDRGDSISDSNTNDNSRPEVSKKLL